MSGERYDAVVLGAGPAGEVATGILAGAGLKVALVERELVGGECSYWACIPSKTLLRPPEVRRESSATAGVSTPELDWPRVAAYRDWMIRQLDDSGAVSGYEEQGVTVFKSAGKVGGQGRVEVDGQVLETEHVIVATGSEPQIPPIDGLAEAGYWTNREATTLKEIPPSAVFIGGGAVGGRARPDARPLRLAGHDRSGRRAAAQPRRPGGRASDRGGAPVRRDSASPWPPRDPRAARRH